MRYISISINQPTIIHFQDDPIISEDDDLTALFSDIISDEAMDEEPFDDDDADNDQAEKKLELLQRRDVREKEQLALAQRREKRDEAQLAMLQRFDQRDKLRWQLKQRKLVLRRERNKREKERHTLWMQLHAATPTQTTGGSSGRPSMRTLSSDPIDF